MNFKKILEYILFISILSFFIFLCYLNGSYSSEPVTYPNYYSIISSVSKQHHDPFQWVYICDVPYSVWCHCNLPILGQHQIIAMNQKGLIWCSGDNINDSAYCVIKIKDQYIVEWFKFKSTKWFPIRTCITKLEKETP